MFKKIALYAIILFSTVNNTFAETVENYITNLKITTSTHFIKYKNKIDDIIVFFENIIGNPYEEINSSYENNNDLLESFIELIFKANEHAQTYIRNLEHVTNDRFEQIKRELRAFIDSNKEFIQCMIRHPITFGCAQKDVRYTQKLTKKIQKKCN